MRTHAERGQAFASALGFLPETTLKVIRSHHERWDGTGYPDGQRGEEIPLAARIFAVCDVFDALTHERPYKGAWPAEKAIVEIHAQASSQFDPSVVATFIQVRGAA